jgi:hypothetical protein
MACHYVCEQIVTDVSRRWQQWKVSCWYACNRGIWVWLYCIYSVFQTSTRWIQNLSSPSIYRPITKVVYMDDTKIPGWQILEGPLPKLTLTSIYFSPSHIHMQINVSLVTQLLFLSRIFLWNDVLCTKQCFWHAEFLVSLHWAALPCDTGELEARKWNGTGVQW